MEHSFPQEERYESRPWLPAWAPSLQPQASPSSEIAALLHDARNMVGALQLYSELLEEPGVLALPFRHYAGELQLVGNACRRLLEKLTSLNLPAPAVALALAQPLQPQRAKTPSPAAEQVHNLAAELETNHNLLSAIVGPSIAVTLILRGSGHSIACPIALTREDLTRILVNLARNAAQAMPAGGTIEIALEEFPDAAILTFSDTGPGIPEASLEAVFSPGYTTGHPAPHVQNKAQSSRWPTQRRGLGLSIVRTLISAAGGSVWAARPTAPVAGKGATIVLQFPYPESSMPDPAQTGPAPPATHPPL
jgi:signal transduction histidine kinase